MSDMTESSPDIHVEMEVKPLKFFPALGLFAIPAGIMIAMYYGLFQMLLGRFGKPGAYYFSYIVAFLTILFLAVAMFYYRGDEDVPATWENLRIRFSLKKLTKNDWKWILITLIPIIPLTIGMGMLNTWLIDVLNITIPWSGIWENQVIDPDVFPTVFQIIMMILLLCVEVTAEEVFFRGYLYPRQEKVHGKWTWVVHGLMWFAYHAYKWFNMLPFLFNSLLIPLLWHKTKNTSASMISHFIGSAVSIAVGYMVLLL